MTRKLCRIDPDTWILQELDQKAIKRTAAALIAEILLIPPDQDEFNLHSVLLPYAQRGFEGKITKPVDSSSEPLQYELLDDSLPLDIANKYASFSFYTNGLTSDQPEIIFRDGIACAWVDCED